MTTPLSTTARTPRDQLDRVMGILARMVRYWWAAALVAVVGAAGAVGVGKLKKPRFRSESVLLYREGIRWSYLGAGQDSDPARKLGLRLKEMVLSRPRLAPIVEKHHLYEQAIAAEGMDEATDLLKHAISFRVRDGDTFLLAYEGEDPDTVQAVTQELAQALVEENTKYRAKQADETRDFLDAEKKQTEDELRQKEFALAQFLARHPEFAQDTQQTAGSAVRAAEKEKRDAPRVTPGADLELLALQREAHRLQQQIDNPGVPLPRLVKPAQQDPRLVADKNDAEAELTAARRDLADKQARFTEQHPDVRAAAARVKAAEDRLRRAQVALDSAASPDDSDPQPASVEDRAALQARLARIEAEINRRKANAQPGTPAPSAAKTKSVAQEIVELETDWSRLNREVTDARDRTKQLQDKQFVASMAATSEAEGRSAQMVIVDPAYKPTHPTGPGKMKLLAMGLFAALGMGVALSFGLALLDDRLYDRHDVERLDVAPVLVVVPRPPGRWRAWREERARAKAKSVKRG